MFHGPRLTSRFLAENFYGGRAIVRVRSSPLDFRMEYCAYIAWVPTKHPRYCEIALAYVAEDLEGNGMLRETMAELLRMIPDGMMPFLITKSPAMVSVAEKFGFHRVTKPGMPDVVEWAEWVGIKDRPLPDTATRDDPYQPEAQERWLMTRF